MKSLIKEYVIQAPLSAVFDALTNPEIIAEWSGSPAEMEAEPGGSFYFWNGSIYGTIKEISPTKIVQEWQEESWETTSKVTFTLSKDGEVTRLKLVHINIPSGAFDNINEGWDEYYMNPMIELLESDS